MFEWPCAPFGGFDIAREILVQPLKIDFGLDRFKVTILNVLFHSINDQLGISTVINRIKKDAVPFGLEQID